MIESLGILIQQLAIKISRCVELDHLPLQQGKSDWHTFWKNDMKLLVVSRIGLRSKVAARL